MWIPPIDWELEDLRRRVEQVEREAEKQRLRQRLGLLDKAWLNPRRAPRLEDVLRQVR